MRIIQPHYNSDIKVFISHYQDDSTTAEAVLKTLEDYGIDAYLDLLDSSLTKNGKKLTRHLKDEMNNCTDLLVVMSSETRKSSWVPFEIGMASHKGLPTVTYLTQSVTLPEYLEFWPRFQSRPELSIYAERLKSREKAKQANESARVLGNFSRNKGLPLTTDEFYDDLKKRLNLYRQ